MPADVPRTHAARVAAETALVRVVHHYGDRPEFVLIGGLMPELLCLRSEHQHAGTTDVDVQVDLEIARGTVNVRRLEHALRNADFQPDSGKVWRWSAVEEGVPALVKFELLVDDPGAPSGAVLTFDECDALGAMNLRGTGFASRDVAVRELRASAGDLVRRVEVNVTGLAGFLLAKIAAARDRRLPKDWYDIAFVLIHNDQGGPEEAARAVLDLFTDHVQGDMRTALLDLDANFTDQTSQGPRAYVAQMMINHPDLSRTTVATDSVVAVRTFCRILTRGL